MKIKQEPKSYFTIMTYRVISRVSATKNSNPLHHNDTLNCKCKYNRQYVFNILQNDKHHATPFNLDSEKVKESLYNKL